MLDECWNENWKVRVFCDDSNFWKVTKKTRW
jgi:hypothetical protein